MTRQTWHCLDGFASDNPGTCPTCGDRLYPKGSTFNHIGDTDKLVPASSPNERAAA